MVLAYFNVCFRRVVRFVFVLVLARCKVQFGLLLLRVVGFVFGLDFFGVL